MLGLLEYFWNTGGVPAPTPAPAPPPSKGGGRHEKHLYLPFSDDYWKARAERLATGLKSVDEPTLEEKQAQLISDLRQLTIEHEQLLQLQQTHTAALASLRSASSVDEMKLISAHISQLAETGKALTAQYKARIVRAKSLRLELMSKENG